MKQMKALIIEDEKLSSDSLVSLLVRSYPECEVIGVCASVREGIDMLSNPSCRPDIILSDVRLSDGVCFSIFDKVKVDAAIVFTTAFDNYALKAFEYYSAAYILKPVMEEDLRPAVEKAIKMRGIQDFKAIHETVVNLISNRPRPMKKIMLVKGDNYYLASVDDICAIVVDGRHVKVYTDNGVYGYDSHNLRFFEENLDMTRFERVNRQTIVATDKISGGERLTQNLVRLKFRGEVSERVVISYESFIKMVSGEI